MAGVLVGGCDTGASDLTITSLPEIVPNLPSVPTLPPPPYPVTYQDGSYSVFGIRARVNNTMDNEHEVTGYIVEMYVPPECEEQEDECPPVAAPHIWIADAEGESDNMKRLTIVGYAENQTQIDEALAAYSRGRYRPPAPETGEIAIPVDWEVGAKVKVRGQFTRISGTGFNVSNGLLEYRGHSTISSGEDN